MSLLLAGAALVDLVTAASFLAVGAAIHRRVVEGPDRPAARGFVTWWWAMATYLALQSALSFAGVAGVATVAMASAVRLASGPLLALAVWGLTSYLLYLYVGRSRWSSVLGVYFVLVAVAYDLMTILGDPVGVVVGSFRVTVVHATPPSGPLFALVLASFGLPIIVASVAYLFLLRHVAAPAQRYRILLVASSLIVWVTAGFLGQLGTSEWFRYASVTLLGLAAALVVFLAYYPPAPLRVRWSREAAA